jgi:hypothetical protein
MSRVLRRPMFRGGIANSEGTGITSGLENQRQGYADGPTIEGVQPSVFQRIYKALNPPTSDILKKLQERQKERPLMERISDFVSKPVSVADLTYGSEEEKQAAIAAEEEKIKLANKPKEKVDQYFNENNVQSTKKDLSSFYDEYMSMINKANLVDQDELTKQKYLELAKFGLNLMGQPGGPPGGKKDLFGAISRAAEKPLEGYSNILSRESQMKQIPKQLALQASINAMAPGQLEKNIQGLINAGLSPKKALEFVTKEGTYQQRIQDREEQSYYSPVLERKFNLKNPTLQQAASKSFVDWLKIDSNLNIGQISPIPADTGLAIDKKYYIDPNTGVIVKFDKKINNYREAGEI